MQSLPRLIGGAMARLFRPDVFYEDSVRKRFVVDGGDMAIATQCAQFHAVKIEDFAGGIGRASAWIKNITSRSLKRVLVDLGAIAGLQLTEIFDFELDAIGCILVNIQFGACCDHHHGEDTEQKKYLFTHF